MFVVTVSAGTVFVCGMLAGMLFSAAGLIAGAVAVTKKNKNKEK